MTRREMSQTDTARIATGGMAEAFGQALLDQYRGERDEPLYQRDGESVLRHPVEDFYFGSFESEPESEWVESRLDGPLLDLGAGSGRDVLYFQSTLETVALEISDALVELLDERGVRNVRQGSMFDLRELFERDRFGSALAVGTQLGLATSMQGLRTFLGDLAAVTTDDATALVDGYDPTYEGADDMLGFRADPAPGLAYRVMRYEYDGVVGDTLLFRLVSPERLCEATTGTDWRVAEIRRPHDAYYYRAVLTKKSTDTSTTQ
jgi:hypothetical protein